MTEYTAVVTTTQPELELVELTKLLLDEERLLILGQVTRRPCSLDDLTQQLPVKRAALIKGLRRLREAGLVRVAMLQGDETYELDRRELLRLKQVWFGRPQPVGEQTPEAKTLAAFVRDGRLTGFPVQPAKRDVVLRWLAEEFVAGRTYTEKEVNEVLRRRYDDTATLRRYLVDFGFMARDHGVYWKPAFGLGGARAPDPVGTAPKPTQSAARPGSELDGNGRN